MTSTINPAEKRIALPTAALSENVGVAQEAHCNQSWGDITKRLKTRSQVPKATARAINVPIEMDENRLTRVAHAKHCVRAVCKDAQDREPVNKDAQDQSERRNNRSSDSTVCIDFDFSCMSISL